MMNKKGVSLVETLVATAVLGGVALGLSSLMSNMTKDQKVIETSVEISSIHQAILLNLANEAACKNTLIGVNLSSPPVALNDIKNAANAVIYDKVKLYGNGNVKISSISVSLDGALTTSGSGKYGRVAIDINYLKAKDIIKGNKNVTKRVTIPVTTDPSNVVQTCFNDEGNYRQNSCGDIGGTWDQSTLTCTLRPHSTVMPIANTNHSPAQTKAVSIQFLNTFTLNELDLRYLRKGTENLANSSPANQTTIGDATSDTINFVAATNFNGNMTLAAGSTFTMNSDKSLKEKINPLSNTLEKIDQINGVSFLWKNNHRKDIGFIAQDIQKVYPELVKKDPKTNILSVNYVQLNAVTLQAVKELKQKNKDLESEVKDLRAILCELHPELKKCEKK